MVKSILQYLLVLNSPNLHQLMFILTWSTETGSHSPWKVLEFWVFLKSPWKWICPWKVLEFRVPSLKFSIGSPWFLVLCILYWKFEWIQQIKRYKSQFFPKNFGLLRSQQLISFKNIFPVPLAHNYIIQEQLLYPSFPKNTYRYLCILCVSMYQSVSKWAVSTLYVT